MPRKQKKSSTTGASVPERGCAQSERRDSKRDRDRAKNYGRKFKDNDGNKKASSDYRTSGLNDVSWYSHNPELLMTTAAIPYPYRPGMYMPIGSIQAGTSGATLTVGQNIPGAMTLAWIPSIGYSDGVTSPASIAAKELYAKVRSKYSGALEADGPDMLIYLVCLDSIFSYIGALKRLYRVLDSYSPNNFAMPSTLLRAMGFTMSTVEALRGRKADLLYAINQLVLASRKFAMPNVMDFYNRHYWLNDNVYTDAASINSQFYVFVQSGFYQFALLDENGQASDTGASGAILENAPWSVSNDTDLSVSDLYAYGNTMISALAESDDAYTISGYLMRAYEGAPQFVVETMTGTEEFAPLYVPEVLMQIENAEPLTATDLAGNISSTQIYQNPSLNTVLSYPAVGRNMITQGVSGVETLKHIVSVRSDTPSIGDTVVATRFKAALDYGSASTLRLYPASEILVSAVLVIQDKSPTAPRPFSRNTFRFINVAKLGVTDSTGQGIAMQMIEGLTLKSQFDWAPISLLVLDYSTGTATTLFTGAPQVVVTGDLHNATLLDNEQLKEINRVCMFSELNSFES